MPETSGPFHGLLPDAGCSSGPDPNPAAALCSLREIHSGGRAAEAEKLVSDRDPHAPPLGPDEEAGWHDMNGSSSDSGEDSTSHCGSEPRSDDAAGADPETLTSPADSDEDADPPE